jgi:hypothetical protein
MSVLVECFSVVVKRSVLETRYPGGLAAYQADCANKTLCADEHLVRVGFMVPEDVNEFVVRVLGRAGLASTPLGIAGLLIDTDSVSIVEHGCGPWQPDLSGWLEYAERPDGVCLCWLAGRPPGELHVPTGWTPELPHHSAAFVKLKVEDLPELKPMSSAEARKPLQPGHVRLFQRRVYSSKRGS